MAGMADVIPAMKREEVIDLSTQSAAPPRRRKRSPLDTSRLFYLFISPWLIGFIGFTIGPMLYSLFAAFSDWNGVAAPQWTGLKNAFTMVTGDDLFWKSIGNTFYFALVSVPLNMIIALFLANLLNKRMPFSYLFRSVFYLPSVVAGVAVYIVWMQLYNPYAGIFNDLLSLVGIDGPMWLLDERTSMLSLILMNVFTCGGQMLILLAGLQDIPGDYYEAASLDGASGFRVFFSITLPLLTPVIFFNLVMGVINSLQIFAQPHVMTGGGPMYSTYVYGLHLYNTAFRFFDFGYACTLAWALFIIIMALSLFIFRSSKSWVYYREEVD